MKEKFKSLNKFDSDKLNHITLVVDNTINNDYILHALFNNIDDFLFILDLDGNIIKSNNRVNDVLGYSLNQLTGMSFFKIYTPELRAKVTSLFKQIINGKNITYEIPFTTIKGELIPVETKIIIEKINNSDLIVVISKDLRAMLNIEEIFQKLFWENSSIMALIDSENEQFVNINNSFIRILGFSKEEILGRTFSEVSIFNDYLNDILTINDLKDFGNDTQFEVLVKTVQGVFLSYFISCQSITIRNTKYLLIKLIDTNSGKEIEQKVLVSDEKYRKIFETIQDVYFRTDINGYILEISPSILKYSGYSRNELIYTNGEKVYVNLEDRYKIIKEISENGEVADYEILMKRKDDSIIYASMNAHFIINEQGIPVGMEGTLRDISQRKLAEEKLQKANAYNRSLFQASLDPLATIELTGKITDVNNAAELISGFSREDLIGSYFSDYFTDKNEALNSLKIVLDEGKVVDHPLVFLNRNGHNISVVFNASSFFDIDGNIIGIFASIHDISGLRRIENDLIESEKKYRNIFENIQDVNYQADLNGNILEISPLVEKYGDYKQKELIGKNLDDYFINSLDRINFRKMLFENNEVNDFEIPFKSGENDIIYTSVNAHVVFDENKNPKLIEGTLRDISSRKKAEEKSKESETKLKTIFDLIPVGITIADENGNLIEWNKACTEILGITDPEEFRRIYNCQEFQIIRQDGTILSPEESISFRALKEDKLISDVLLGIQKNDGSVKWINVSAIPLHLEKYGVMTSYIDFTLLKIAEDELVNTIEEINYHRDKLEETHIELNLWISRLEESEQNLIEANASKDKFFSIIAHDLRSPFSGLLGISDLMAKEIETLSIQEIKEMVIALHEVSVSTFQLLNELLEWSRVQTNNMPFKPEEIELNEILIISSTLLKNRADSKNIIIEINSDHEIITYCDRNMLSTIIRNLLSNAIKFTNIGGKIIISSVVKSDEIEISIKDDGVGIESKNLDKLFKIEHHITTQGTANEQGTGLGLILCKEFVEKHNGRIWVDSEEGKGSTFHFTLPKLV